MTRRGSGDQTAPTPGPAKTARPPRRAGKSSALPAAPPQDEEEECVLAPALSNVVGYLLRRSHNAFQGYWMATFRDSTTPITPVQGGMLVVLSDNPGLSQTALARMMKVEGPTLMQSIDRLEEQGYLQRLRRIGDRRSYSLQLTERGQEVLAAINAFLPARDQDLLGDLSADEVKQLAMLLTKVIRRGHQRLKELQAAATDAEPAPKARLSAKGG